MNDEQLKKTFSDMHIPAYEKSAKQHTLQLALSEFDTVYNKEPEKNNAIKKHTKNNKINDVKKPWRWGVWTVSVLSGVLVLSGTLMFLTYSFETSYYDAAGGEAYPFEMFYDVVGGGGEETYFYQENRATKFKVFHENTITQVHKKPVSTFSIDVDTVSYSLARSWLNMGNIPPKDSIRIEEMVNYFNYAWPAPETKVAPLKSTIAITPSPWKEGNKLIHIGIKGYAIETSESPRSNLIFLLDVSGSMQQANKLPLVKNSVRLLLDNLKPDDTVAFVVYAGAAGTVLKPTQAKDKAKIIRALEQLSAGGSTAGSQGIQQAYALAQENFDKNAVNRIILATDGDFNVGLTDTEELKTYIAQKRKNGIFLSILGFGMENFNDELMQVLAQNGNGTASYIDTLSEARKVLVEEATSTPFTIAKDVKIQVEFNPENVAEYHLIGYETRALQQEDFNNDKVDAGEIGAGHTLTAIYEITPINTDTRWHDKSRYQETQKSSSNTDFSGEYAFLKMRYKLPDSDTSTLITTAITTKNENLTGIIANEAGWATAVAGFSLLLKDSKYTGKLDYDAVIALAQKTKGDDLYGYRSEFINIVKLTKALQN